MRNAVVVLLLALVAGTVQAQEVTIGPSQASIAGRMAIEDENVIGAARCHHDDTLRTLVDALP
jgi:hypothetical protein